MKYKFYIVDVFSSTPFGGNQLAVLPEAAGISSAGMQKIAREFNFAESTFVTPAQTPGTTCRLRIFTPSAELAFAGHPTVGTACALVRGGHVGPGDRHTLIFEEGVGPVTVAVRNEGDTLHATLTLQCTVEQPLEYPASEDLAAVLSLPASAVSRCFFASVGVPFCFAHLASREDVDRARLDRSAWQSRLAGAWSPHLFFFAGDTASGSELYARMTAPALGIEEDPATGAASAALVGALAQDASFQGDLYRLSILQGAAMGRPSHIEASARKIVGTVSSVSVGGATAYIAAGEIEVPDECLDG
jgi:trans-2,3-dihydro-3-hydroxyanthranilate isomerase